MNLKGRIVMLGIDPPPMGKKMAVVVDTTLERSVDRLTGGGRFRNRSSEERIAGKVKAAPSLQQAEEPDSPRSGFLMRSRNQAIVSPVLEHTARS
jgi:hypothetical protein